MSDLLRFDGVGCVRGGRILFESLDLALAPGEALHLSGPNGSGKSSLIRLAAGLLRPARGNVESAECALADEQPALDRERSLGEALAFWSGLRGPETRAGSAMDALDITRLAHVPVRLLSTGQLKRAALARVAASGAPLWLLDEPLNGLDSDGIARLDRLMADHLASGGAILAASHGPLAGRWTKLELGR